MNLYTATKGNSYYLIWAENEARAMSKALTLFDVPKVELATPENTNEERDFLGIRDAPPETRRVMYLEVRIMENCDEDALLQRLRVMSYIEHVRLARTVRHPLKDLEP